MNATRLLWLDPADSTVEFPDVSLALREPDGLLAAGGDLCPERLLTAYRSGIFPWYEAGQPILWWSPDPRCVLLPGDLRIARRLARQIRNTHYEVTFDAAFANVIDACAATGGVIGIVGYGLFLSGGSVSAENVARHIDYVVQRVGPRHVGFSTDYVFDPVELAEVMATFRERHPEVFRKAGPVHMMEPERIPYLTDALLRLGYPDDDVRAIMGGNWLRVASDVWQ